MFLTADEVLTIANRQDIPVFTAGSIELDDWDKYHGEDGHCYNDSGWYLIQHTTPGSPDSLGFLELCRWWPTSDAPFRANVPAPHRFPGMRPPLEATPQPVWLRWWGSVKKLVG